MDALECWSGFVWLTRCLKIDTIPEDVERTTLSLFRHRPDAVQKLEQLLRRLGSSHVPESVFDRSANGETSKLLCNRTHRKFPFPSPNPYSHSKHDNLDRFHPPVLESENQPVHPSACSTSPIPHKPSLVMRLSAASVAVNMNDFPSPKR